MFSKTHSLLSKMLTFNSSLSTPSLKDARGTNIEEYQPLLTTGYGGQSDKMHSVNEYQQQLFLSSHSCLSFPQLLTSLAQ